MPHQNTTTKPKFGIRDFHFLSLPFSLFRSKSINRVATTVTSTSLQWQVAIPIYTGNYSGERPSSLGSLPNVFGLCAGDVENKEGTYCLPKYLLGIWWTASMWLLVTSKWMIIIRLSLSLRSCFYFSSDWLVVFSWWSLDHIDLSLNELRGCG